MLKVIIREHVQGENDEVWKSGNLEWNIKRPQNLGT